MPRRNSYSRNSYNRNQKQYREPTPYSPPRSMYYVKPKTNIILVRFAILLIVCITMLTGGSIRIDHERVLRDVYPNSRTLPELIPEEVDENAWVKNLVPPVDGTIYMAWDHSDGKLVNNRVPSGVNAVAPEWFYLEEDEVTGRAVPKNLLQMGNTQWNPQEYVEICHANGTKVWGMFACLGKPDLAMQAVTDMELQQEIIDQLVEWVIAYQLDGISLDFEKMYPEYNEDFVQFAKRIKEALPSNQNTVSAAVTVKLLGDTSNNLWQSYDRGGLAEVIDYVAVMTYEGGNNDSEPRAGIKWVETHVQRLLEEMPSNKLILGIPFYGVDYIGKVINGDSFNVDPLWKTDNSYVKNFFADWIGSALANGYYDRGDVRTYVDYWLDKGSWNEEYGISQYSFVDTDGYVHKVYVDDESSLYQKTEIVKKYQLAGVGVWREGFGNAQMWEAVADGLSQ